MVYNNMVLALGRNSDPEQNVNCFRYTIVLNSIETVVMGDS